MQPRKTSVNSTIFNDVRYNELQEQVITQQKMIEQLLNVASTDKHFNMKQISENTIPCTNADDDTKNLQLTSEDLIIACHKDIPEKTSSEKLDAEKSNVGPDDEDLLSNGIYWSDLAIQHNDKVYNFSDKTTEIPIENSELPATEIVSSSQRHRKDIENDVNDLIKKLKSLCNQKL